MFEAVVAVALLLGCGLCIPAADAISSERRQGTLGLLFLTRVKSFDVVLGKLASTGLSGLCALIAFLPVLMIPLAFGGVTPGEVFRAAMTLGFTLLFALAAGLCASSMYRDRAKSVTTALSLLAIGLLVPGLLYRISMGGLLYFLGLFSPLSLLHLSTALPYAASPHSFWASLVAVHAATWFLLLWSWLRLRRGGWDDGASTIARSPEALRQQRNAVGLLRWQPEKAETEPIEWLVFQQAGVHSGVWAVAMLALLFSRWAAVANQSVSLLGRGGVAFFAWPMGIAGAVIGGLLVARIASRFFSDVRRTGELELLMTTPLGAERIVKDQWRILKRIFVWPLIGIQIATFFPALGMVGSFVGPIHIALQPGAITILLLSLANTFVGISALCWASLWFSLRKQNAALVAGWAMGVTCLIPWIFSLCCLLFLPPGTALFVESGIFIYLLAIWILCRARIDAELSGVEQNLFGQPEAVPSEGGAVSQ